jgi:hypothetical protein
MIADFEIGMLSISGSISSSVGEQWIRAWD